MGSLEFKSSYFGFKIYHYFLYNVDTGQVTICPNNDQVGRGFDLCNYDIFLLHVVSLNICDQFDHMGHNMMAS